MTRLRLCLAALSLSLSAGACAATSYHPDGGVPKVSERQTRIDRAALRAKLAERRAATITNFLAYRDARVYPINQLPGGGFRHVWVDDNGNLCAAATLISKDWGRDATVRVGAVNNELQLALARSGPVVDWMLTSGLTRAELVAIQVPGFEWQGEMQREREVRRLFTIYQDVERQLRSLAEANLELAVDELMKKPALARALLAGRVAGPGQYETPVRPPVG